MRVRTRLSNVSTYIGVYIFLYYAVLCAVHVLDFCPKTWGDDRAVSEIHFAKVSQNKYNIISKERHKSTKNHKVTMNHKRLACHVPIKRSNLKVYISIIHKHAYRCNC